MITPTLSRKVQSLSVAASTTQTLEDLIVYPTYALQASGIAYGEYTSLTPSLGTSTAGTGDIATKATPQNPSAKVYLHAAPTATVGLLVEYVPVGEILAAW